MSTPSLAALKQAVQIREQIETLQGRLASILGSISSPTAKAPAAAGRGGRRGKLSAAGRARIIAAQKARWAKVTKKAAPAKKKGGMSAAAKAKLSALMKARWAKRKKAGKTKLG